MPKSESSPTEVTSDFWHDLVQRQRGGTPRLAHLLLRGSSVLLARFKHFYTALRLAPSRVQQRWQKRLATSLN